MHDNFHQLWWVSFLSNNLQPLLQLDYLQNSISFAGQPKIPSCVTGHLVESRWSSTSKSQLVGDQHLILQDKPYGRSCTVQLDCSVFVSANWLKRWYFSNCLWVQSFTRTCPNCFEAFATDDFSPKLECVERTDNGDLIWVSCDHRLRLGNKLLPWKATTVNLASSFGYVTVNDLWRETIKDYPSAWSTFMILNHVLDCPRPYLLLNSGRAITKTPTLQSCL